MKCITLIGILLLISVLVSGTFLVQKIFSESGDLEWNIRNITTNDTFEQETKCGLCPWRFYKHYHYKQCELAETDDCGCPKKFSCPTKVSKNDRKVCTYLNVEYGISSLVDIGDPCYVCRCVGDRNPQIVCNRKECRHIQWPNEQNCHPVYKENKCCPTEFRCVSDLGEFNKHNKSVCVHENKTYPLGAHVHFLENPCLICTCTENWNEIDVRNCQIRSCPFQAYQRRFDAQCIPVYHEKKCCPIEFYCPDIDSGYLENSIITQQASENIDDFCVFGSQQYSLGSELNHTNPCIQCKCNVPPDFTCVHKSCPKSPAYENCDALYYRDKCCPAYDCRQTELTTPSREISKLNDLYVEGCPTPMCASTTCKIGILPGRLCPTCICDSEGCPTPMCANPTCKIGILPNRLCPTCICDYPNFEENEPFSEIEELRNFETNGDSDLNPELEVEDDASQSEKEIMQSVASLSDNQIDLKNSKETIDRILTIFRRKRSNSNQYQQSEYQQHQQQVYQTHEKDYSEIEREYDFESERNEGVDEIKLIGRNQQGASSRSFNEISDADPNINWNRVVWTSYVEGCPTPMCANPTCMIGILPGQHCPSCICNYPGTGQP